MNRKSLDEPAGTEDGQVTIREAKAATDTDVVHFAEGGFMEGNADPGSTNFAATNFHAPIRSARTPWRSGRSDSCTRSRDPADLPP